MSDYIKQLEVDNEELRQQLADALTWKPFWVRPSEHKWVYQRGPVKYATIYNKTPFSINFHYFSSSSDVLGIKEEFLNIDDAKACCELCIYTMLKKETD